MPLIHLENVSLAFGEAPLLDGVNLKIEPKERIFLIGRNGMGKSCLLNVMLGHLKVDSGKIHRSPHLKIAALPQDLPNYGDMTVYDAVAEGLEEIGSLLKSYHHLIGTPPSDTLSTELWLKEIETVQKQLEDKHGWQYQQNIDSILTRLNLPADKKMNTLSGGWQRRVILAKALVSQPDLLLLDEPTNHLDLETIEWLEDYLTQFAGAVLCITHDRALLRKFSQRILELDRGKLISFEGSYDKYLIDKEHRLEVEVNQAKLFDKKLAKEETWIRQGIKARRTRNEGRVRALKKLREERKLRREKQGKPSFSANDVGISGELVITAEDINYQIPQQTLIKDFSIRIFRGDKIALVGPNGIGKSTLLKVLLGELPPQSGVVKHGTNLQIGYFDQLRSGIKPELSVQENVAGGRETITINGQEKHIISYLSDFLFTPDRSRTPVKNLSGGECNRLLFAKLFSLPTNFLVLDEPTNDLDIETLELLEEILTDYKGTLLLVSHDREFIDKIATSTLFFSGNGKIQEYVGGYQDIPAVVKYSQSDIKMTEPVAKKETLAKENKSSEFTSKMKKELQDLPEKIALLEAEQSTLWQETTHPDFYNKDKTHIAEIQSKLSKVEKILAESYARWEELEQKSQ